MNAIARRERPEDAPAVYEVNRLAFGQPAEADLVETLRPRAVLSMVAEVDGHIVGHILFTRMSADSVLGLAPMAVRPEFQRKGIGSLLIRAALEEGRSMGAGAVVVLGHPDYYPKFGFVPASRFGLRCEFEGPFMALEWRPGTLKPGEIRYDPAFTYPSPWRARLR